MNTVKHLRDLNSRPLQKKRYPYWANRNRMLVPAIFFSTLLGTYLDLYFVGMDIYSFPIRPMPSIFPINIGFTLIGLPVLISVFLYLCAKLRPWKRAVLIIILSLLMSMFEKQAEEYGFFVHSESWKHIYTFIGYMFFYTLVYGFYAWTNKEWELSGR